MTPKQRWQLLWRILGYVYIFCFTVGGTTLLATFGGFIVAGIALNILDIFLTVSSAAANILVVWVMLGSAAGGVSLGWTRFHEIVSDDAKTKSPSEPPTD